MYSYPFRQPKTVEKLKTLFPDDSRFELLVQKASAVKIRMERLESARKAADSGDIESIQAFIRYYPDDLEFKQLLDLAKQLKRRKEDHRIAETLAAEGKVEELKQIIDRYPDDERLRELLESAKHESRRQIHLAEAESFASKGHVAAVKNIAANYSDDRDFENVIEFAVRQKNNLDVIEKASLARKKHDIDTILYLSRKYPDIQEIENYKKEIRRDGEYWAIAIEEFHEGRGIRDGILARVNGTIVDKGEGSNTNVVWIIIQSKHSKAKLKCYASNKHNRYYFRELPVGQELTIWGLYKNKSISDVTFFTKGEGNSFVGMQKDLTASREAFAAGQIDLAFKLQEPYYSQEAYNIVMKVQEARRNQEFDNLEKDGLYTIVTGKQLSMFAEKLDNRKVRVKGVLLSDISAYGFAIGYNISQASFQTMDRVQINGGIYFKSRSRISKGTYVILYGLLKRKEGFFGVKWQINPVDKLQIIEGNY